jgi:peptidoglycan/LPS O-acetylase OafA/YrhL
MRRLGYRPGLDGLRGVAILVVVAFHAAPGVVMGGYLGVDVFFVLSGFLITWLLFEEMTATGTISLTRFYARRVRRLLPALLGMATAFLVVAPLMTPERRIRTLSSLASGVAYVGNWTAAAGHAPARGLGHVWSLAIEEQFYVVWPVLLLALLRAGGRAAALRLASVAALAGLALREVYWRGGATAARVYYGTDTRGAAILLGAAVALIVSVRTDTLRWVRGALTLGASAATAYFAAALVGREPHLAAFSPTFAISVVDVGTALVMAWLFTTATWAARALLSARPLVYVGRRSYGLYLWHVPCIEASRAVLGPSALSVTAGVATAAVATLLSYRFIERPFLVRRGHVDVEARPAVLPRPVTPA